MSKAFYRIVGGIVGFAMTIIALCLLIYSDWMKKTPEHAGVLINAAVAVLLWPAFLTLGVCRILPPGFDNIMGPAGMLATGLWMPALGVWAGGKLKHVRNRKAEPRLAERLVSGKQKVKFFVMGH